MKILIIILLLVAPAFAQTPAPKPRFIGFGGLYVSIARTTPINEQTFKWRDANLEWTAIFPIRNSRFAFQVELIKAFDSRAPLLRGAVAFTVFKGR